MSSPHPKSYLYNGTDATAEHACTDELGKQPLMAISTDLLEDQVGCGDRANNDVEAHL